MNANSVPADERSNLTPSPPPAQIAFPPILFSPLLFQSNSPLASPHTPPSITRQNPFDLLPASLPNPQSSPPTYPVHDTSPFHDDPRDRTPPPTPHSSLNNTRNMCMDIPKNDPHLDMTNHPHLIPSSSNSPKNSPPVFNTYINASFPSSPPPTVSEDPALEICFEDDALSPLERIYLLSRSAAVYHRCVRPCCPIPVPVFKAPPFSQRLRCPSHVVIPTPSVTPRCARLRSSDS